MKKINWQFKLLYVIGIMAVVCGHSSTVGIPLLFDWFPPYSFQVGLFVFCSGYFSINSRDMELFKFIRKQIKKLILPLLLWNLFYGILVSLMYRVGLPFCGEFNLINLIVMPFINGHQFYYNLGSWFVTPLFLLQVANMLMFKLLNQMKVKSKELVSFFAGLIIGILGGYLSGIGYNNSPFGLAFLRVVCMAPFYELGILYRTKLEEKDRIPSLFYFFVIFIIQLFLINRYEEPITYSLSGCGFSHNVIISYFAGFLAIAFWIRVSRILEPIIINSKIINCISNNTYTIMVNHLFGFMITKLLFAITAKITPYFQDFNFTRLKEDVGYFYLPNDIFLWYCVYILIGILVSLFMQYAVNKLKFFLIKILAHKSIIDIFT